MAGRDSQLELFQSQLIELDHAVSFGAASGSLLETTKEQVEPDSVPNAVNTNVGYAWATWGSDNYYPQNCIDENMQEPYSAAALRFKRNAHYGKGLCLYEEGVDAQGNQIKKWLPKSKWPKEIQDFFWMNDIENFTQDIINQFEWFNSYHVQYIPNKTRNKILQIYSYRTVDMRSEKRNPDTGNIENYYYSRKWSPYAAPTQYAKIPAFDKFDPFRVPNGIYKHSLSSIDRDYYIIPEWHSNVRVLSIARKIPIWILANINNSVNIKYHVRIPQGYFEALFPEERYPDMNKRMAEMKAHEKEVKQNIDNMLAGADNASKIFYSKIAIDADPSSPNYGKPMPGWEIIELKNELKDTAWLSAYGSIGAAMCTAHNMPPSLAGVIVPNGLGAGSGSNVREEFNFYTQLNVTQPRQTTLEWWEFVKRFNNWPADLHLGYRDIVLQTLDENKSGFAVAMEQKPTTAAKPV